LHTQARLKKVNPFPAQFYHAARHGVTQKLSTPLARYSTGAQLDAQLRDESIRRATGEVRRIPQLEDQLACKDKQIIRLCWRRPHLENYNLLKWFEAFECPNT